MNKERLDRFYWRYGANKNRMKTAKYTERHVGSTEELNKLSKEELIYSVLALATMAFQDIDTIDNLVTEINALTNDEESTMNVLTEQALAIIMVLSQMGQGVPTYLFNGYDIIDSISGGFVVEKDKALYLTDKGIEVMSEIEQYGEVKSFNTKLSKDVRKEGAVQ